MNVYFLIPSVIFSALVAFFTLKVARYTKEYTEETRRLWEITKKSYFVKAVATYLFERYSGRIEEWPPSVRGWVKWAKPPKEEEQQIFKDDCHRVTLEELFPEIKKIEETGIKKLEKEGYKFEKKFR